MTPQSILQECKDEIAQKHGYLNYKDFYEGSYLSEFEYMIKESSLLFAQKMAEAFAEWIENQPILNRVTVWPPAGSGGSHGLYLKTRSDLYTEFLDHLNKKK